MCMRGEQGESLRQTTATAAAETAWLLSESRFSPRSLLLFTAGLAWEALLLQTEPGVCSEGNTRSLRKPRVYV